MTNGTTLPMVIQNTLTLCDWINFSVMIMDLKIGEPLTLKSGLRLPNRLVKSAMTEQLADQEYLPTETFEKTYAEWAKGGWGLLLTGNVQVDTTYLGGPRDTAVDPRLESKLEKVWKTWAATCKRHGTPVIMQLNHPGKQSPYGAGTRGFFTKNIAPSAIPMHLGDGLIVRALNSLLFGTPREMTEDDIRHVVDRFVYAANLAARTGFDGIELHAAHGYLLSQFMSAQMNQRTDAYGGSSARRTKIVVDILKAIKETVPPGFTVGLKVNSVDHQSASELRDCIEQLKLIAETGVDFLEISGGTYEDLRLFPSSMEQEGKKAARTVAREAFFLEFAEAIRNSCPQVPLIVTGGFRTRPGMERAVQDGACDLVGIGRPAVLNPVLPKTIIFNREVPEGDARLYIRSVTKPWLSKIIGSKAVGAGVENQWYSKQLQSIHMMYRE